MYVYKYLHTCMYTHIYVYIYIYTCVCIYAVVYTCICNTRILAFDIAPILSSLSPLRWSRETSPSPWSSRPPHPVGAARPRTLSRELAWSVARRARIPACYFSRYSTARRYWLFLRLELHTLAPRVWCGRAAAAAVSFCECAEGEAARGSWLWWAVQDSRAALRLWSSGRGSCIRILHIFLPLTFAFCLSDIRERSGRY